MFALPIGLPVSRPYTSAPWRSADGLAGCRTATFGLLLLVRLRVMLGDLLMHTAMIGVFWIHVGFGREHVLDAFR